MAKKKEFVEGIDYVITIRKRKKFIKNPKKNICPICENCNHKNLCLNRRNKETMERCKKCKNCSDYENCDKFHFYNEYEGRLLKLGINANTGKAIRQSFSGKSEEIVLEKLRNDINPEVSIQETNGDIRINESFSFYYPNGTDFTISDQCENLLRERYDIGYYTEIEYNETIIEFINGLKKERNELKKYYVPKYLLSVIMEIKRDNTSQVEYKLYNPDYPYRELNLGLCNENPDGKINKVVINIEKKLTDGMGFDFLADSMDRASAIQDEFLTKTNQIYETNELLRKIGQDIDKTNRASSKEKLKNFAAEIQALQDQTELQQTDLDIAKAKYAMLQAEMTLEDARNAKSTVRLQRDNEGNYGYVYTADQNAVDNAEADYAQKANDLYNLYLSQANDYGQRLIQLEQEELAALSEIDQQYMDGQFDSWGDYQKARSDILTKYGKLREAYTHSYTTAIAGLEETAATDSSEAWVTEYGEIVDTSIESGDTIEDKMGEVDDTLKELDANREIIFNNTELGLNDVKAKTDELTAANDALADEMLNDVIPTMDQLLEEVRDLTYEWAEQYDQIMELIDVYLKLIDVMNKALNTEIGEADIGMDNDNSNSSRSYDKNIDYSYLAAQEYNKNGASENFYDLLETRQAKIEGEGITNQPSNDFVVAAIKNHADEIAASPEGVGLIKQWWDDKEDRERILLGFDTGGYTGDWSGNDGKLAILHSKELVLNADDTENILSAVSIIRDIVDALNPGNLIASLLSGLSPSSISNTDNSTNIQQEVTIHAEFPNATDHNEIEEAFNTLINRASQYAGRY